VPIIEKSALFQKEKQTFLHFSHDLEIYFGNIFLFGFSTMFPESKNEEEDFLSP